jgi:DNA-binding FadR family transcriptional regulator
MSTAQEIADRIQRQIESGRFPLGGLIGTEAELRLRHGVSLPALRQAFRILEQRQVAAMRRGANGGLYAERPSVDATANYIAALWERTDAARRSLLYDAQALDGLVLRRASERMNVADAATIADLHDSCKAVNDPIARSTLATRREHFIAQLTGNPVIVLGHAVTLRFLRNIIPFEVLAGDDPAFAVRMLKLVDEKISTLISGEVHAAIQCANEYSQTYFKRLETLERGSSRHAWSEAASQPGSLPMLVSRTMLREIRERGWKAGEYLGQEAELMRRYDVGRITWRQALSILIEYSAVESRRGGAGGIYVAPINRQTVMETASRWLTQQGARTADGLELFATIAPHHAVALLTAGSEFIGDDGSQPISCETLLDLMLRQDTSPLLSLAALTVTRTFLCGSSPIDLRGYRHIPSGSDITKRAVLTQITALLDSANVSIAHR